MPASCHGRLGLRHAARACLAAGCLLLAPPPAAAEAAGAGFAGAREEIEEPAGITLRIRAAGDPGARLFWQGRAAYLRGEDERACSSFEEALDEGGEHPAVYFWLGRAYGRQAREVDGTLRRAAAARRSRRSFEKAVALDPDYLQARLGLVSFHLVAPGLVGGDPGKARDQAREVLRRDRHLGHLAWGAIYEHAERWDRAARAYESALRSRPQAIEPYLRLVWLHQRRRRFEEAFRVLERGFEGVTDRSLLLYEKGRTAAFSGLRGDEGRLALRSYLAGPIRAGAPSRALALSHLAMIHRHLGDDEEALKIFRRALSLEPDLNGARRNIEDLERFIPDGSG